jgi:hypothetical protein
MKAGLYRYMVMQCAVSRCVPKTRKKVQLGQEVWEGSKEAVPDQRPECGKSWGYLTLAERLDERMLGRLKRKKEAKPGMVALTYSSSTCEVEVGGP